MLPRENTTTEKSHTPLSTTTELPCDIKGAGQALLNGFRDEAVQSVLLDPSSILKPTKILEEGVVGAIATDVYHLAGCQSGAQQHVIEPHTSQANLSKTTGKPCDFSGSMKYALDSCAEGAAVSGIATLGNPMAMAEGCLVEGTLKSAYHAVGCIKPTEFTFASGSSTHREYPRSSESNENMNPNVSKNQRATAQQFRLFGVPADQADKVAEVASQEYPHLNAEKLDQTLNWKSRTPAADAYSKDGKSDTQNAKPDTSVADAIRMQMMMQEASQTFGELGKLGARLHCKPLMEVAKYGPSVMQLGLGIFTSNPMMIANGALGLMNSILGGGPDINEIILKQLEAIQKQIDENFKALNELIKEEFRKQNLTLQDIKEMLSLGIKELSQRTDSMRVEMQHKLDKIQDAIAALNRKSTADTKAILLQPLRECQTDAERLLINAGQPAKEIQPVSHKLYHMALSESALPTFNGANVAELKLKDNEILDMYKNAGMETMSHMTGEIAEFYRHGKGDSKKIPEKLLNVQISFSALDAYLSLNTKYMEFHNDADDQLVKLMLSAYVSMRNFAAEIKKDKSFVQNVLDEHYKLVDKVKDLQKKFVAEYTEKQKNDFTENYPFDNVKDIKLDFFSPAKDLIAQFSDKKINKLAEDRIASESKLELDRARLADVMQAHKIVSPTLLTAAYMKKGTFSAVVKQSKRENTADLSGKNLKEAMKKAERLKGECWDPGDDGRLMAMVGQEFFRATNDQNSAQITEWTLPAVIRLAGDEVAQFNIHGRFHDDFATRANIWVQLKRGLSDVWWTENGGTEGVGGIGHELNKYLPTYIQKKWNAGDDLSVDNIQKSDQDEKYRKIVEAELSRHKDAIFSALTTKASNVGQKTLNELDTALTELDVHYNRMQAMLHFCGYDAVAIDSLELPNSTTLMKRQVIESRVDQDQRVTEEMIGKLVSVDPVLHPSHPLVLCERAINLIEMFEKNKKAFIATAGHFAKYIDIHKLLLKNMADLQQFFQQVSYKQFEALYSQYFKDAKFGVIDFPKDLTLTKEMFLDCFKSISNWALHYASESVVTGDVETRELDLASNKDQLIIASQLKQGWESNIRLLMRVAQQLSEQKESFPNKKPIVNFTMCGDALESYLELIESDAWHDYAQQVGHTEEKQCNKLQQMVAPLSELREVIYGLYTKPKYLNTIISGYQSSFKSLVDEVTRLTDKVPEQEKNRVIRNAFNNEDHAEGMKQRALQELDAYYYLLVSYCQMLFGYRLRDEKDPLAESFKKLQNADNLSKMISDALPQGDSIYKNILERKNEIDQLCGLIKHHIKSAADESACRNYLSYYWDTHKNSNELNFNSEIFSDKKITSNLSELIIKFLDNNPQITKLDFSGMDLHFNIKQLVDVIEHCPQITGLNLSNTKITDIDLADLVISLEEKKCAVNLTDFILQGNSLTDDSATTFDEINGNFKSLRNLDISNNVLMSKEIFTQYNKLNQVEDERPLKQQANKMLMLKNVGVPELDKIIATAEVAMQSIKAKLADNIQRNASNIHSLFAKQKSMEEKKLDFKPGVDAAHVAILGGK